jgi:hypothetical protein
MYHVKPYSEYAREFARRCGLPHHPDALELGELLYRMRGAPTRHLYRLVTTAAEVASGVYTARREEGIA